jgi:hypothetical protein
MLSRTKELAAVGSRKRAKIKKRGHQLQNRLITEGQNRLF